jgi:hypothetical protein
MSATTLLDDWRGRLYIASLDFFELFLERHAPTPRDRSAWDRLERTAWRLHGHAADAGGGSPGAQLHALRSALGDCQNCLKVMRTLAPAPDTLLAFQRLERVVKLLNEGLDDIPEVLAS